MASDNHNSWWKLKINEIESENKKTELFDYVKGELEEGKKFIKGEKIGPLISDLKLVVIKCVEVPIILSKAANESTIKEQWNTIFEHPDLQNVDDV